LPSHGAPSFFVRGKKCFLMLLDNHHGDGIVGVNCKVLKGDNTRLIESEPQKFFMPAYIGSRGWVAALTRGDLPPDEPGLVWCDVRATRVYAWRRAAF
jgi:hypothetical protein